MSAPILPSSPSSDSVDEGSSPSSSSNPWKRTSSCTDVTEFDDIYDASDNEDPKRMSSRKSSIKRQSSSGPTRAKQSLAKFSPSHRDLPKLTIPASEDQHADAWSGRPAFKKLMSPVPPTPPAKVEMSPAVMSLMHAQQSLDVPTISAPPSLDGSLSSEQMAAMSAPPTPVIGAEDHSTADNDWSGVQLQPGALAILRALSGSSDVTEEEYQTAQVIEIPVEPAREMQQQTPRRFNAHPRPSLRLFTEEQGSLNGLTRLDIPSPGGFFSGLSPRTRHTWHMPSMTPDDIAPPTSTTAEQFYRLPWNDDQPAPPLPAVPQTLPPPPPRPQRFANLQAPSLPPVEQIVEVRTTRSDGIPTARPAILEQVVEIKDDESQGFPTARRVVELSDPSTSSATLAEPLSPHDDVVATEIVVDYDAEYARKQQQAALSNLDRTELWLMAQKVYLKGVHFEEVQPEPDTTLEPETEIIHVEDSARVKTPEPEASPEAPAIQRKKTVRFSEIVIKTDIPRSLPLKLLRQESAYYRAFQEYVIRSRSQDSYVHRLPRFEALQAQRVSLREQHRNQLLGKYQLSVVPQSAKKRMSANVARGDDVIIDDPEKLKREKEAEALSQMAVSNWHVSAVKMLNGGRLFTAPLAKRLARLSRLAGPKERARILDLGGQATCDWAWHCAITYPNTKVYTATTKAIRQLSNSNIRGPPNHRQVAVERLAKLPFPDNYFDLVSARELHSILKFVGENGEDEWESCLKECMRVLKPGGYLEFSLLDSDIMNAGPLGLAKSVEFGFALKTLGYDPSPTKMFLGRLQRTGFGDIRRAWMCLPMGEKAVQRQIIRDSVGCEVKLELEAMVLGSTENVASICGLAGSWAWEKWLLRCEAEKLNCEDRLLETAEIREAGMCLEGVPAIMEEGRKCGACWRVLNGFARKPTILKESIVADS